MRPLDQFPPNFEASARANGKGTISPATNERMLLNTLLSEIISHFLALKLINVLLSKVSIFKADPDVIVGHEFLSVSLDVLLHRMRELKVDHWSRLGRFRRSKWPSIGRQGTNMKFLNGRLVCDLAGESAKVGLIF